MDASVIIAILFVAMILTIIVGFWYYSKKVHSIASSRINHADLLASVQDSIKETKPIKEEK